MNFQWMQIFLSVLEQKSFSAAARKVHLTQPAVSSIIRSLEEELGQSLLVRSPGQRTEVIPSRAGEIFADFCRDTLLRYGRMQNDLLKGDGEEIFSLISSSTTNASFTPLLLRSFQKTFPAIHCHYSTGGSEEELLKVRERKCDLAIISFDDPGEPYECRAFLMDPLELIVPINMEIGNSIKLQTLKKLPLIIRSRSLNSMQLLEKGMNKAGTSLDEMNVILEVRSMSDVLQMISMESGCGFIPRSVLMNPAFRRNVKKVEVKKLTIDRELKLIRLKNRPHSLGAQLFWNYTLGPLWSESPDFYSFKHDR